MHRIYLGLVALAGLGSAQNCPLLGPAYLSLQDPLSSNVLQNAKAAFNSSLAQALATGRLNNKTATFSIQVFSSDADAPIYEYHHASGNVQPNSDTLYRLGSISKLVSVYAILAKLGHRHWDDPVVKYVPELAAAISSNPVDDVDWREVTLGSLASHLSGVGRDYALGAISGNFPGLPPLSASETVTCNNGPLPPCSRSEALHYLLSRPPVTSPFHMPIYSNMAFQLLAYAIESITGQKFEKLVTESLIKPLKLSRTFLSNPGNDSNAVVGEGWAYDLGDENPAGGYYQSLEDLSKVGKSILNYQLLSKSSTQKWLKPLSHTSSALLSTGRPWDILRIQTPVSINANSTRLIDTYTKNGGIGVYNTLLALSPDHHMGISILTADGASSFGVLQSLAVSAWLPAAEEASREQADSQFAGNYTLSPPENTPGTGSHATFSIEANQPGLTLSEMVFNGTDMLALLSAQRGGATNFKGWAYPMDLAAGGRVAFRVVYGPDVLPISQECTSWASVDLLRYGTLPLDLIIFHVGHDGKATEVEIPALKATLARMQ